MLAFVIPLPGGGGLVLGTATTPLVMGVILGAIGRTGPVVWTLPGNVTYTLNQFSLLIFLVAVGTGAGPGLVKRCHRRARSWWAWGCHRRRACAGVRDRAALVLKYGTARSLGRPTGSQLNPAPYAYAMGKVPDQQVAVGYAVLFPVSMIAKVFSRS